MINSSANVASSAIDVQMAEIACGFAETIKRVIQYSSIKRRTRYLERKISAAVVTLSSEANNFLIRI
jgi:hypothetical protein